MLVVTTPKSITARYDKTNRDATIAINGRDVVLIKNVEDVSKLTTDGIYDVLARHNYVVEMVTDEDHNYTIPISEVN